MFILIFCFLRSRSPRRHKSTSRSPQNSRSRKDSERDRGSVEKKKSESHDKEYRSRSRSRSHSTGRHVDKDVRNRSRSRSRSASVGYHGDVQQEAWFSWQRENSRDFINFSKCNWILPFEYKTQETFPYSLLNVYTCREDMGCLEILYIIDLTIVGISLLSLSYLA